MISRRLRYYGSGTVLGLVFLSVETFAHGGHDSRLKISMSESEIRIETSVNAETFQTFDINEDGRLAVNEFELQRAGIVEWIDDRFQLLDSENQAVKAYFSDAPIVDRAHLSETDHVKNIKIIRRYKRDKTMFRYTFKTSILGHDPQLLFRRSGSLTSMSQYKFEICISGKDKPTQADCVTP